VRAGVRVAADHRHPGERRALLGPITWTMPCAHRGTESTPSPHARDVGVQASRPACARSNRGCLRSNPWSAYCVGGGDDHPRATLAAGEQQPSYAWGLVTRHEMAVDVEQRRAVRLGANDVAVQSLSYSVRACMVCGPRRAAARRGVAKMGLLHAAMRPQRPQPRAHEEAGDRRVSSGVAGSNASPASRAATSAALGELARRRLPWAAMSPRRCARREFPRLTVPDAAHRGGRGQARSARAVRRARRPGRGEHPSKRAAISA